MCVYYTTYKQHVSMQSRLINSVSCKGVSINKHGLYILALENAIVLKLNSCVHLASLNTNYKLPSQECDLTVNSSWYHMVSQVSSQL